MDDALRATSAPVSFWAPLLPALLCISGCDPDRRFPGPTDDTSLDAFTPEARIGLEAQGDPLSVFHKVLDAALLEDRVIVLDMSPPYVRGFDLEGEFLYSAVGEGEGPEELRRPLGLNRVDPRTFAVNDAERVLFVSEGGEVLDVDIRPDRFIRGVIGCGKGILELSTPPGLQMPGRILRYRRGARRSREVLVALDSIRHNSRRVHPLWAHSDGRRVVLYPEESGRSRLLEIDCLGSAVRQIAIDSLGRQEYFERTGADTYALHPAAPPLPAGLVVTQRGIVWATQERDSTTTVTLIEANGRRQQASFRGWFQVADSQSGRVLLVVHEPVSHVLLIREDSFLDAVARR